jgi:pyruvate dehydrogenase E2 component (dihydrolipoamide acetyltransferase)
MLEFKLPEVGENIKSGTVISLAVKAGDSVRSGQDLLELETDKATIPVPSPVDGVIKELFIKEGQEVKVGAVIMKIEAGKAAPAKAPAPQEKPTAKTEKPKSAVSTPAAKVVASAPAAPAARMAVRRIPNEDIPPQVDVPAAPAVRRLARELGIIVSHVPGSGPGGRIKEDDVKAYAKGIILGGGQIVSGPPKRDLPDFQKFGEISREKMNNVRKKTAEHLSYCWNTIPHVTQFDKADITELEDLRRDLSTDDFKLTITSFLLKVVAMALKEFPKFNASIDMDSGEIIYKKYINLGVAVDTDRGLLVPVLKDVDKKGIIEITNDLNAIAERARNRKTGLDELQGGSMTLTNLGGIGGYAFTPIVNWPEVAILGASRGGFEPVYSSANKTFVPRFKLPLTLSYDHRLIDGADGARFLRWVCTTLEKTPWEDELKRPR